MALHQDSEVFFHAVTLKATTYTACYGTALLHAETAVSKEWNGLCEVLVRCGMISAGEYQDENRSTECKRCDFGTYQDGAEAVMAVMLFCSHVI